MKTLLILPVLLLFSATLSAQEAALKSADDARVAAMKAGDGAALGRLLSDELRYSHSNGVVDTKASLVEVLASGKTKYTGIDYEERAFSFPAPGIALMTGRARVQVTSARGQVDAKMAFLAVWREEQGQWRFLAWQSCKIPPPEAK